MNHSSTSCSTQTDESYQPNFHRSVDINPNNQIRQLTNTNKNKQREGETNNAVATEIDDVVPANLSQDFRQQLSSQQIEALFLELTNTIKDGFSSIIQSINELQAKVEFNHQEFERSRTETRRLVAESLREAATIISGNYQMSNPEVNRQESPINVPNPTVIQNTTLPPIPPQVYRMDRDLTTITQVWHEYTIGLSGKPPIQYLEDTYGTGWRKDRTESRFYSRRNIIYKEIQNISRQESISEEEAAQKLERRRMELKASIHKMTKMIKESNRQTH